MTSDTTYSAAEKGIAVPKKLASHLRALDKREETLDILLEHYKLARTMLRERTLDATGRAEADSKALSYPNTWDDNFQELERALQRMAKLCDYNEVSPRYRDRFLSLQSWYIAGGQHRVPMMRSDKKGRRYHVTTANGPQYELVWFRDGDPGLVLEGLTWLSLEFVGEPKLSKELEEKRAA